MAKKITPGQIKTARTAFRNGKSIPECCSIASMSKTSFNKYLGKEIEMWTQERLAKADNKIMIETQMEQDRLVDKQRSAISTSDEDFIQLLELEFSKATTFEQARELYWVHKPEAITNLTRVEAFRAIYEQTLNRVTGRPVPHNPNTTQSNTNLPNQDSITQSDKSIIINRKVSNKEIIKQFKAKLGIHIPVPRNVNEFELDRVKLHICWWIVKSKEGKKGADVWYANNPSIEDINKIIESVVNID